MNYRALCILNNPSMKCACGRPAKEKHSLQERTAERAALKRKSHASQTRSCSAVRTCRSEIQDWAEKITPQSEIETQVRPDEQPHVSFQGHCKGHHRGKRSLFTKCFPLTVFWVFLSRSSTMMCPTAAMKLRCPTFTIRLASLYLPNLLTSSENDLTSSFAFENTSTFRTAATPARRVILQLDHNSFESNLASWQISFWQAEANESPVERRSKKTFVRRL